MEEFFEQRLVDVPIVVLDTETTGLIPNMGHRIVEIGAVRLEPGQKGPWQRRAEFSQLLNPGRRLDPGASRVNGIYDSDLIGKPAFADIVPELFGLLEGAVIVAHNASFDASFIGMELYIQEQIQPGRSQLTLANPWLCTLRLARRHFYFGNNSLSHVAQHLGVRVGRAHRALTDVYMTAEVLKRLARELAGFGLETVGDLLHAQGGAIYAPHPPKIQLPQLLAQALAEKRSLRIRYVTDFGLSERVIDPLYATNFSGGDYLIAYCHLRREQRTFRIDRILSAELAGNI